MARAGVFLDQLMREQAAAAQQLAAALATMEAEKALLAQQLRETEDAAKREAEAAKTEAEAQRLALREELGAETAELRGQHAQLEQKLKASSSLQDTLAASLECPICAVCCSAKMAVLFLYGLAGDPVLAVSCMAMVSFFFTIVWCVML